MNDATRDQSVTDQLFSLLKTIFDGRGDDFSGIGVIISDHPDALPTMSLQPAEKICHAAPAVRVLGDISRTSHPLHDGFHLLTSTLGVSLLSQYFSPPIVLPADTSRPPASGYGGRYWAALFGSAMPGVIATGVASTHYGVVVFRKGQSVTIDAR